MVEIIDAVTRVVIIHDEIDEFHADEWGIDIQDGGRTVKLFAKGDGDAARVARSRALAEELRFKFS